jgi:hypothetical protein
MITQIVSKAEGIPPKAGCIMKVAFLGYCIDESEPEFVIRRRLCKGASLWRNPHLAKDLLDSLKE